MQLVMITILKRLYLRCLIYIKPLKYAAKIGVRIGAECRWICPSSHTFGSEPYLITIGDHVTIGEGVRFITHDGGVWVLRSKHPNLDIINPISIGNNVFLGSQVMILPGVTIGENVVIGARAVVTRSIPSNHIAVGVPARVVSTLSDYEKRCITEGIATKQLNRKQKRLFLERHFEPRA